MCFNMPQKVILVNKSDIVVENHKGEKINIRSLVDTEVGDYVLVENGVAIEKISKEKMSEIIEIKKEEKEAT